MKKDLVVGLGEIGLPIYKLFSKSSITGGFDIDPKLIPFMNKKNQLLPVRFIHICIPYGKNFLSQVVKINKDYEPEGMIIHSTIEPSTTKKIQKKLKIPIIYSATRGVHGRMLTEMKSQIEAMRGLTFIAAEALDLSQSTSDPQLAKKYLSRLELLTPIVKSWCTDQGCNITSIGIQVHGGYGYIEETGAAQHLRDSRISPIYEGTNGIQAIDLVGRKLKMNEGKVIRDLLDEIKDFTESLNQQGEEFETIKSNLTDSLQAVEEATAWLAEKGTGDPIQAISGATPYLRMLGQLVGGLFLARLAIGARSNENVGDADFRNSKMTVANFYAEQLLPLTRAQLGAVTAGSSDLFAVPEELFST